MLFTAYTDSIFPEQQVKYLSWKGGIGCRQLDFLCICRLAYAVFLVAKCVMQLFIYILNRPCEMAENIFGSAGHSECGGAVVF